jgi:hypothetical protein
MKVASKRRIRRSTSICRWSLSIRRARMRSRPLESDAGATLQSHDISLGGVNDRVRRLISVHRSVGGIRL